MRAPLVLAATAVAAGILIGMEWPVPPWGGPLAPWAVVGATVSAWQVAAGGATRRGSDSAWPVWLLLLAAGAFMGAGARLVEERSCARWLPEQGALELTGLVEAVAGERVRLRVQHVTLGGARLPCGAVLPARWAEASPPPGSTFAATGRWWRFPSGGAGGPGGMLLLDRLEAGDAEGRSAARLARARAAAGGTLDRVYGPRAALAGSLLLARRDGLDREVRERFARAGLSHLLAISGLHVGLVAGVLLLLAGLVRLERAPAAALAAAATVAYVLFLGAPASAARAALQVVLVLTARALQRPARPEALVAAAALVLLAADPASLRAPGFQLSFAGVAGLIALRPPLLARLDRVSSWRPAGVRAGKWLADSLAASTAATIATAPIAAWHFGRLAPVGVIANLAAIPLMGALVPTLGLSLVLGSVWDAGGRFIAGAGGLMLDALDRVAALAAAVPGGSLAVRPRAAAGTTFAVAAGYAVTRRSGRVRPLLRTLTIAGTATAVLIVSPVRPGDDAVELHMIDVGQGDAVAIRSPAGRWILVDAGIAGGRHDAGERVVVPYLERRGVRRLEAMILTHPHLDHFGGAGAVIRAFRPRWIADPGEAVGAASYLELLARAVAGGHAWIAVGEGMELELDGMMVEFLHPVRERGGVPPGAAGAVADPNDVSVVVRIEYGEFSALLTGDAPAGVESWLVARHASALEAEVLKLGHHGSATSTTPALLEATRARVGLVSAGRGNRYGHPHAAVLRRLEERGIAVHRTDTEGTVVIRGDAFGRITIRSERGSGR